MWPRSPYLLPMEDKPMKAEPERSRSRKHPRTLTLNLSDYESDALITLAVERGLSKSDWIRQAIREAIRKQEQKLED
jgi:hypothetical protein